MKNRIVNSLLVLAFASVLTIQSYQSAEVIEPCVAEGAGVNTTEEVILKEDKKPVYREKITLILSEEVSEEATEVVNTEVAQEDTNIDKKEVVNNNEEEQTVESIDKYSYCPIGINDNGSLRQFYCENKDSGVISDHIYTSCNGCESIVLAPGSGWDSIHVCDPTVIEGNFSYQGVQYRYLMSYLGCNTTNSQNNQIGLAVSNSLGSGWVRVYDHPFISFNYDSSHPDAFQWGVGQPSLISIDNGGKVAIFYTEGTWNLTSEKVEVWDLSNLDNPVNCGKATVSNSGVGDFISNADFCYNQSTSTLYMISDVHPFSGSVLSNIADASRVVSTVVDISNVDALGSCNWSTVKIIDSGVTGHQKNHNAGFIRDSFGHVGDTPDVLCTVADEKGDFLSSLWTYTIQFIDL